MIVEEYEGVNVSGKYLTKEKIEIDPRYSPYALPLFPPSINRRIGLWYFTEYKTTYYIYYL